MRRLQGHRQILRGVALLGLLLVVCTVSLALRANAPAYLLANEHFDDALFPKLAGQIVDGHWLGPFDQFTLAKGPAYPIFISLAYDAHLPLKIAEQVLHLVAAGAFAIGIARLTRQRALPIVVFTTIALNPAYLGASASRIVRDGVYGSLSLLLTGLVLVFMTLVPAWVRWPARRRLPAMAATAFAIGVVAAAYYTCREERVWLAPSLVITIAAGIVAWWSGHGLVSRKHWQACAFGAAIAGLAFAAGVGSVSYRNNAAYGSGVISDLADGNLARAYAAWQRVEVGEPRDYVPVSSAQRQAVYAVSPAAAELRPHLEGPLTAWFGAGCDRVDVCDDYAGGWFIWAMRGAASSAGHFVSEAEVQKYFGRMADDIERACGHAFECSAGAPGPMPPLSRVHLGGVRTSLVDSLGSVLSFGVADPDRPASVGSADNWNRMRQVMRGVDDQATYVAAEQRALSAQGPVRLLQGIYRELGRIAVLISVLGVVVGLLRRNRNSPLAIAGAALFVAVVCRLALIALVDATSFPATRPGPYFLPAMDFYVAFLVIGSWLAVQQFATIRPIARWRHRPAVSARNSAKPDPAVSSTR